MNCFPDRVFQGHQEKQAGHALPGVARSSSRRSKAYSMASLTVPRRWSASKIATPSGGEVVPRHFVALPTILDISILTGVPSPRLGGMVVDRARNFLGGHCHEV
jgi:hypothetical protein